MSAQSFGSVLLRRAARIGERRADLVAQRYCDGIKMILPDIRVWCEGRRIRLTGRGLRRRWITDAALRWLGRLLR